MFNIDYVIGISALRWIGRESGDDNPVFEPSDNELLKCRSYWGYQQTETEDVRENSRCEEHGARNEDHEPIHEGVTGQLSLRQLRLDPTEALGPLLPSEPSSNDPGDDDQAESE